MSVTSRYISTGYWTDPRVENRLKRLDEKAALVYLRANLSSAMCGFYQLSLSTMASQLQSPPLELMRLSEIIALLEQTGYIVYDDGYVWLPNFLEEQSYHKWPLLEEHVHKVRNEYLKNRGSPDNKAFRAFLDRFADMLAREPERKKQREKQKADRQASRSQQPTEPRTSGAVPFPVVHKFFEEFRSAGAGDPCPHPVHTHADEFFQHYTRNKPWPADWQKTATSWIMNRIKSQRERPPHFREATDGRELPGGGALVL